MFDHVAKKSLKFRNKRNFGHFTRSDNLFDSVLQSEIEIGSDLSRKIKRKSFLLKLQQFKYYRGFSILYTTKS